MKRCLSPSGAGAFALQLDLTPGVAAELCGRGGAETRRGRDPLEGRRRPAAAGRWWHLISYRKLAELTSAWNSVRNWMASLQE